MPASQSVASQQQGQEEGGPQQRFYIFAPLVFHYITFLLNQILINLCGYSQERNVHTVNKPAWALACTVYGYFILHSSVVCVRQF